MKEKILSLLKEIQPVGLETNIVDAGMVSENSITVNDGKVVISINVPDGRAEQAAYARDLVENNIKPLDEVKKLLVVLTRDKPAEPEAPQAPTLKPGAEPKAARDMRPLSSPIPGIKQIVAVASGKGGVGKSTTSANLALGLASLGFKVGLMDADVYGPSLPRLFDIKELPPMDGDRLVPAEKYGMKLMSMGFLIEEENPILWRGPMVVSALMQMMREVDWGELDILVLDMPPGTGDAQLTMAQQVPLAGAVIVSTPQDLALIDARKGLRMFQNVDVPILGLIENMSTFICPHCGKTSDIFGHGGAENDARRLGVMFLGAVPLEMKIRETSDAGTPIVVAEPDSIHAQTYKRLALKVATLLSDEEDDEG
jgi:ATP-binding protein involved in chromosome partitioning